MTLILMLPLAGAAQAETARFSVTDQVAAPAARAVTATIETSGEGARFFPGGDFEPIVYRNWMLASADSAAESPGHINVTAQDIGGWDVLRDGALDGAEIEVLRIENGQFREVRRGVVAPDGYAVAGWFAATGTNAALDPDLNGASVELAKWERPGVPRWFTVRAYDSRGRLS
ncbi:MAG: hypothetical protein Q4G49_07095, partial [Paracoccus sp. (in: a-proteobacteria)]|nr:hypothetical protein [Paracoccus sp. (in: a-proteobacteria)]